MAEQNARAKADEARKHSQIDESGAAVNTTDNDKTNPSDRSNTPSQSKDRSQIDESGAQTK